MPTGSYTIHLTDLLDGTLGDPVELAFTPTTGSAGGARMHAVFAASPDTEFTVHGIPCRGGPGTLYQVQVESPNYRPFAFFQLIREGDVNTPPESLFRLVANPRKVRDITAPSFSALTKTVREMIDSAAMIALEEEDRDLRGARGEALYDALGPLRRAALLNIAAKAGHSTSAGCLRFLGALSVLRQDRLFCAVRAGMPEFLRASDRFKSAPGALHEPLPGFQMEESFKSIDSHANLQVTFMRHKRSGELAADVDIDEATGIEHGFEVIRNRLTRGRTNPYLVRELLLLAEIKEKTLDPGYRFVFASAADRRDRVKALGAGGSD